MKCLLPIERYTKHEAFARTVDAGKPDIAVFDPATGRVQQFQYAAPSMAAHPAYEPAGFTRQSSDPQAVWLTHMAAMTTDGAGHLWYIRAGSDTIEEVAA